jgi:RNA recognition motif-containing protein
MNIYVGNMNFNLGNDDLFNLFSQFGAVTTAKIINDKVTGRSKGFGFVEMDNEEEGRKAISSLNESEVMGRKLIVNEARPQEPRQGGGGSGGGGGFKKRNFGGGGGGGGYNKRY